MRLRWSLVCAALLLGLAPALVLWAAASASFAPYDEANLVIGAFEDRLPNDLRPPSKPKWDEWSRAQDQSIRARLDQGDLDSMANLLMFGTSFTAQPRISVESIAEASRTGVLRARVDDLAAAVKNPGNQERLLFLADLLRRKNIDPSNVSQTGTFLYSNLLRVMQERRDLAIRAAMARENPGAQLLDRQSLFSDRGVSLDTSILPNFSIDQTLRDLKQRGVLREGQVLRAAVVGPGLDFIDKNEASAFDYYPQQTIQPFALYDSLLRLGLATDQLEITVFDISARTLDHLERAAERARNNTGYTIQLPRDVGRPWPPALVSYWKDLGSRIGREVEPLHPPEVFADLQTRAVQVRPEVVLALQPQDLNVVLQRLNLAPSDRFDLVVGTNIFVYYEPFQQALALENVGAMLKPGGVLLTNDRLPEVLGGTMHQAGVTEVPFDDQGARDAVGWYQRK